ncbi:MAG: septum formation initiator family protein [Clostridia bacterium]|nr:septum formation initiator family protein [Clostridia bacterium]
MKNYNVNSSYTYNNSNLAYKLPYQEEYDNRFDIRVERQRGLSKRRPFVKLYSIAFVALLAGVLLSSVIQYVTIHSIEAKIQSTKNEIKQVEDEIYNAEVKIAETLDVNYVKKIAVGKLGMVEPDDSQLMYISVHNEDYTVNY